MKVEQDVESDISVSDEDVDINDDSSNSVSDHDVNVGDHRDSTVLMCYLKCYYSQSSKPSKHFASTNQTTICTEILPSIMYI